MANFWIDKAEVQSQLSNFFTQNRGEIADFGSTVNQTFEAFVFASMIKWYEQNGWSVEFVHPKNKDNSQYVKLKFSTRGAPSKFTFARCKKGEQEIQIRHGLRVATKHHKAEQKYRANIVLDVAVIANINLSKHGTDEHVDNSCLLSFGEAKHMSAFAELIANFIGLVHELMPEKISSIRIHDGFSKERMHPAPFLYVSGYLYPTAQGIAETIKARGYDIDIYDYTAGPEAFGIHLPGTLLKRAYKQTITPKTSTDIAEEIAF